MGAGAQEFSTCLYPICIQLHKIGDIVTQQVFSDAKRLQKATRFFSEEIGKFSKPLCEAACRRIERLEVCKKAPEVC